MLVLDIYYYHLQAGYSAYGGYPNYSHPQMPAAAAPQGAAYGAYPSTYPAQVLDFIVNSFY